MFGKIGSYLSKLGHLVKQGLGFVADHLTEDQLHQAVTYVEKAEDTGLDNAGKREYVVGLLRQIPGVNENTARLLCELAVGMVKKGLHKVTEDAVDAVVKPT